MKIKLNPLFYTMMLFLFLFNSNNQVYGQGRWNLTAGMGIPEILNFGIEVPALLSFRDRQEHFAWAYGFSPFKADDVKYIYSMSGRHLTHFGRPHKFSYVAPWYIAYGVESHNQYYKNETAVYLMWFSFRAGRSMNFSYRIGMQMDLGIMYQFWEVDEDNLYDASQMKFWPSLGIRFYVNLDKNIPKNPDN